MKTAKVKFVQKNAVFSADSYVVYQYDDSKWIMSRAFPVNTIGKTALWDYIADLQERGFKVTISKDICRLLL